MVKGNFKKLDLLRKRRYENYIAEPYFIDTKKFIKKGLISGLTLIGISLILGLPFLFRIKFLENKKNSFGYQFISIQSTPYIEKFAGFWILRDIELIS